MHTGNHCHRRQRINSADCRDDSNVGWVVLSAQPNYATFLDVLADTLHPPVDASPSSVGEPAGIERV